MKEQVLELARRSVVQAVRQPALIVPPILFPLTLVAVNVGGFDAATELPGFPTDSYLDFAIAFAFMQGSLFSMVNAGTLLARDVETGFIKRLALTPVQRVALTVGNLSGVLLISLLAGVCYLAVGFGAGMDVASGAAGVVVLLAFAMLVALAFAAVGAFAGLRAGRGEAVQGFFPLFFVALFLSSSSLPRPLIEQDWFRTIATYNPVSYLVEGIRSLIIVGWDAEALALGFGCALAILAVGLIGTQSALRTRLVRG